MKRLLVCSAIWLDRKGAENNRLQRMRAALHAQGVDTFLTGFGPDDQPVGWQLHEDAFGGTVSYRSPWKRWTYPSPAMRRLSAASCFHARHGDALIRALAPDGLLVYTDQAPLAQTVLHTGRSHALPVVVDAAEYHQLSTHYLLNGVNLQQWRFRQRVVPRLDGLVGVGKGWCDWASRRGVPSVWVPGFAVTPTAVRTRPEVPGGQVRLVFIGHWVERECPRELVQGLAKAIDRGVDLQVDVLGKPRGTYREQEGLRALDRFPQLQGRVRFTGYLKDQDRDERLAQADFFVILRRPDSETEHLFPSRIPEYLASGNPLIVSGTKSFSACFDHKKTAWLLPETPDADALAEAIITLSRDPQLRFAIGQAGRCLGQRLFDPVRLAAEISGLFQQARERSRRLEQQRWELLTGSQRESD